jgi:hypothetical protein
MDREDGLGSLCPSTDARFGSFGTFLSDRLCGAAGLNHVGGPVRNSPPGNRVFGKALSAAIYLSIELSIRERCGKALTGQAQGAQSIQ